nr:MAG TPA: hypothetical protein [Caudoviricetes sp.]
MDRTNGADKADRTDRTDKADKTERPITDKANEPIGDIN